MMTRGAVSLVCLSVVASCNGELGSASLVRDHAGEISVSGEAVRTDWTYADGFLVSPVLEAGEGASRVGALMTLDDEGPMPIIEARAVRDGQDVGEWLPMTGTWSEMSMHVAVAELGDVVSGARVRIRLVDAVHLQGLLWNAVIPDASAEAEAPPEVSGRSEALRAELAGLGIVTRSEWGARATRCSSRDADKTRLAIHYTVTPSVDAERQVRGIQRYHMDTNGWCDVGYHFLVGVDGTIYEGRPLELLGAHVGRNNTGNIGIAFVGCFHPSRECAGWGPSRPPEAMIEAGGRLLGRLAEIYDVSLSRSTVKGHREHSAASTSCPGDHLLARIPDLISLGRSAPPPLEPEPTPTPSGVHAGLTQSGSQIPRAGLSNGTLRRALGVSVEPYGAVVTHEGASYVSGKVSWFGGPSDTGVTSTETGAITGEVLRSLSGYFVAMRWDYSPNGRTFWRDARLLVVNPETGARVVVRPVDWGPHTRTGRIVDLSPEALSALGLSTDDTALVAFAAPGTPVGPVR